jgi:hypothetical protein
MRKHTKGQRIASGGASGGAQSKSNSQKSRPSKRAKIPAKFESNGGDYKGEINTSITYQRNLNKALEKRKEKALAKRIERFKLFLKEYTRLLALSENDKTINQKAIIAQLKLSRREFFEFREILKGRRNIKREKVLDRIKKVSEADKVRHQAYHDFQNKISSLPRLSAEHVSEIVEMIEGEILPPIRAKLAQKSERIKEGRKRGSAKGGDRTREDSEKFI